MKITIYKNVLTACALTLIASAAFAAPFKFGVMADTQWLAADDGLNPNSVAVSIIKQLNNEFINKGVKFVVQTGDLEDTYSANAMNTTAIFRQDLFNAGIGFYPLRGNHESNAASASQFVSVFPQTTDACKMNLVPSAAYSVVNIDALQPNPVQSGSAFCIGTISATPAAPSGFNGLNYAFDYDNARFVFLDQFTPTTGTSHSILDDAQVAWMDGQLSGRTANSHAFVYGHKAIISQNHTDGLFGLPSDQPVRTHNFVKSLSDNGVRYLMGGHDHMHNRAIVTSPTDSSKKVQDIVMASDSSKFYIPFGTAGYTNRIVNPTTKAVSNSGTVAVANPTQTNDYVYNVLVAGGSTRETQVSQELNTLGYYIYSVDGPKVTVDYYSAVVNPTLSAGEYLISTTPNWTTATFSKRETFGYSLNGKEYLETQGQPYTVVNETYNGTTTAKILSGTNGSSAKDSAGRALTKTVDTGWADQGADTISDVLSIWGMTDLGAASIDTFALSVSYDPSVVVNTSTINAGQVVALSTKDANGNWVNAVDKNVGGRKRFILGAFNKAYPLGTYGVDPVAHTAWAVVNTTGSGQFAVVQK